MHPNNTSSVLVACESRKWRTMCDEHERSFNAIPVNQEGYPREVELSSPYETNLLRQDEEMVVDA